MSKEALYVVELETVNNIVLNKAIDVLMSEFGLERIYTPNFKIYNNIKVRVKGTCLHLPGLHYPIDIYVEDGKLVINGDEMDLRRAAERIKQFYEGMELSLRYNSPMTYNKKEDELELLLETRL